MNKIGLLTFHCADNFGAVLQTYALQEIIKGNGGDIHIINYKPSFLISPYKPFFLIRENGSPIEKVLSLGISLLTAPIHIPLGFTYKRRQSKMFEQFRLKYLYLSEQLFDIANREDDNYDTYLFGSDQIWNPVQTGMDTIYFGEFKIKKGARKVSYAASMSNYANNEDNKTLMKKFLTKFHSISVREIQLQEYLKTSFNIDSTLVLDPTLAANTNIWNKITIEPQNKGYVLIYNLGMRDVLWEKARYLAEKQNLKIIEVSSFFGRMTIKDSVVTTVSPEKFVGLFKYADYIVTNSFHGTAFSIIFERQFYVIKRGTDNDSRAMSLLDNLGIKHRLIAKTDQVDIDNTINYREVTPKLDAFRKESIDFIVKNILNN